MNPHSIGGALLTIAATSRPDLFHQLILIDSPYFHYKKRIPWGLGLKYLPKLLGGALGTAQAV